MRYWLALALWIGGAGSAIAQDEVSLNDYAQIFQEHESQVFKGKDRRGNPAEVLEIDGAGTLWRTGPQGSPSYSEEGSDSYLCSFLWLSVGAAYVQECASMLPTERVASFNLYVERIAEHVGQGAIPSRDLACMKKAMLPTEPIGPSECASDHDVAS